MYTISVFIIQKLALGNEHTTRNIDPPFDDDEPPQCTIPHSPPGKLEFPQFPD